MKRLLPLFLAAWCAATPAFADIQSARPGFSEADLPDSLRPWSKWVLDGTPTGRCPFLYHTGAFRQCVWPSELKLQLTPTGAEFQLRATLYEEGWLALPGAEGRWPQRVKMGGQQLVVSAREGRPQLFLQPGSYSISGAFEWDELPENLALPRQLGLLQLQVGGRDVPFPVVDASGQLWVKRVEKQSTEAERADFKVFRRITDSIPTRLTTRVVLNVSGKPRELLLDKVMLPGFTPLSVDSAIPARIEPDGTLRLQVRPGSWQVDVQSRRDGALDFLNLPEPSGAKSVLPLPKEEIWVFESVNHLRLVQLEGANPIDPAQTELPGEWRNLPAYYLQQGGGITFVEKKRGNSEPAPDELHLQREWWLDFDGKGYTVRDDMNGVISQSWRLEVQPGTELGRAAIAGRDQFITRLGGGNSGIEVRPGPLNLQADSRIAGARGELSATGWAHDMRSLSGTLHLPPGWQLLHASGVDSISDSWVQRWTLLDIFLLLIVVIVTHRLFGRAAAAASAPGFLLLHHALPVVTSYALVILGCVALLRVLPEGRFRGWLVTIRRVTLFLLLLTALPFMVQHMRLAIFPQLGMGYGMQSFAQNAAGGNAGRARPASRAAMKAKDMAREEAISSLSSEGVIAGAAAPKEAEYDSAPQQEIYQYDPGMQSNTGFGVAGWEGNRVSLRWNGPVLSGQTVSLWLLSPFTNLVLSVLRVGLLAYIMVMLLGVPLHPRRLKELPGMAVKAFGVALALWLAAPQPAMAADYPSPQLLEEMKKKLLAGMDKPAPCLPACASVSSAALEASGGQLTITQEVHTNDTVMLPLPGPLQSWRPASVAIEGGAGAPPLYSGDDGILYALLERGVHILKLTGPLPTHQDALSISFALRPGRLSATAAGWEVQGIQPDGSHSGSVQLIYSGAREHAQEATLEKNRFPALIEVERTVSFGLSWQVQTVVRRLSPAEGSLAVDIPLLPGETVTSADVPVKAGRAFISLPPGVPQRGWVSQLTPGESLTLTAPKAADWPDFVSGNEIWRLNISNLWHVGFEGTPPVQLPASAANYTNAGQQVDMPAFAPRPGETLTVKVTRPEGVPGQTLTLDSSKLRLSAGSRSLEATLALSLRASQGGQHIITLPEGAKLAGSTLGGAAISLSVKDRQVTLPLSPGSQQFELTWNQPSDMGMHFVAPQVDVGLPSVNAETSLTLPHDRWLLLAHGPQMGPAVLFWGWLPVVVLASFALAQANITPLRMRHWLLLLLGLTQTDLFTNLIVAGWLLALGWRARPAMAQAGALLFNLRQLVLGLWTLLSLSCLFGGIRTGLLGSPDMRVQGNGSSAYYLQWYQDIAAAVLPQPGVWSLPLYCYRAVMLVWALWLAFALVRWLQWGWKCFSAGGYWKRVPKTPWRRGAKASGELPPHGQ